MKGIYREILRPDHVVKVLTRDDDGIAYEDGGRIICTRRIKSFDQKFKKDDLATLAELVKSNDTELHKVDTKVHREIFTL
jgi:hypothetical protein